MKKILFILHYPPPVHGAAMVGKFIKESSLLNKTFDATYINLSTSKDLKSGGRWGLGKTVTFYNLVKQVVTTLLKNDYDLCYMTMNSHGPGFYKDVVIATILKLFRKKIVYHFHNKGVSLYQHQILDHLLYRFVFKNTKSIILSRFLYPDIKRYVEEKNTFICPNGIPRQYDTLPIHFSTGNASTKFQILFLSNMMKDKGVWILIEACKILLEDGLTNFECHFVGDWYDIQPSNFSERVNELGLKDHIFAHGKKYNTDKNTFFLKADVFVLPTLNEAFPLVNLEAMQFGLPVIATIEGGIPDVIVDGETGYLIKRNDPNDLASKLKVLHDHPNNRKQMGYKGRERFLSLFTVDIFEQNLTRILNKL